MMNGPAATSRDGAIRASEDRPVGDADPSRYGRIAMLLHWLIGVALIAQIAFGWLLDDIAPRGTPARAATVNLHKSIGIALGLLIAARLLWRLGHRPPAMPASMPAWQRSAARLAHRALYACMIAMPASGYVASNFSKHGVKLFGTALAPWGPDLPGAYAFFNGVHIVTAYLFCALIAGHVAAALKHALVDRDDVFSRMWPWPARRPR
jgi:cytochrome b561